MACPAQFFAAGFIKVAVGWMNQSHFLRLLGDAERVARHCRNVELTIKTDLRINFIALVDDNLDLALAVHHDRAATQGVRVHPMKIATIQAGWQRVNKNLHDFYFCSSVFGSSFKRFIV